MFGMGMWHGAALAALIVLGMSPASPARGDYYPLAWEDPVVDGAFTTPIEYLGANKILDDFPAGYFYKESRQNWTVNGITYNNTVTLFNHHYFYDLGMGQLDAYDANSFEVKYGDVKITTWVFLQGDNPPLEDAAWLDIVGIGSTNYPMGLNDDGTFLVRLNDDPTTDRLWTPGMPKPGDPGWNFANFYGVYARGGFNNSQFTMGYDPGVAAPREMYEWSLTLNSTTGGGGGGGGVPGVGGGPLPGGGGNPPAPPPCNWVWVHIQWEEEVKDWKPEMGGHGTWGGVGYVPRDAWFSYDTEWFLKVAWPLPWPDDDVSHNVCLGPPSLGTMKASEATGQMFLGNAVVTATPQQMDGFMYIEEETRASGIRVSTYDLREIGDRVSVLGFLMPGPDGELAIHQATTELLKHAPPLLPLGMSNRDIGGGTFHLQEGVSGGVGLNNIGLLVKTSGIITMTDPDFPSKWFRVDDGSGVNVKCMVPYGIPVFPNGMYVTVTGISSCERDGIVLRPVIRTRMPEDVQPTMGPH